MLEVDKSSKGHSLTVNTELVGLRLCLCCFRVFFICLLLGTLDIRGAWESQEVMVSSGGGGRGQFWSLFMVEVGRD